MEAQACYSLGNTYTLLRDYPTAIDYHLRHLRIAEELMDKVGEGRKAFYFILRQLVCLVSLHFFLISHHSRCLCVLCFVIVRPRLLELGERTRRHGKSRKGSALRTTSPWNIPRSEQPNNQANRKTISFFSQWRFFYLSRFLRLAIQRVRRRHRWTSPTWDVRWESTVTAWAVVWATLRWGTKPTTTDSTEQIARQGEG